MTKLITIMLVINLHYGVVYMPWIRKKSVFIVCATSATLRKKSRNGLRKETVLGMKEVVTIVHWKLKTDLVISILFTCGIVKLKGNIHRVVVRNA